MNSKTNYKTPVGDFNQVELEDEKSLRFVVTGKCNLACEFCIYKIKDFYSPEIHSDKFIEMTPSTNLTNMLNELYDQLGFDTVHLTGGEPTLAKNLIKIVQLSKSCGYKISMCSNLINIKPIKKLLKNALLDSLTFSYTPQDLSEERSGLSPYQRPDALRISSIMKSVRELKQQFPKLTIKTNIVISPFTDVLHTAEFVRWCWKNDISPRAQRDRSRDRIGGSNDKTKELIKLLNLTPHKVIIRVPGAIEICQFKDPQQNVFNVKVFNKNFRLLSICKQCVNEKICKKSLSNIRIYDTKKGPLLGFCGEHNEIFAHMTLKRFLSSHAKDEIRNYKNDKESYFQKFCTKPNFQ